MIRLTAYVSGRVQRVGYRSKVVSLAKDLGLVGFVQNRPDGRVFLIAEGERNDDLEKFASAIQIKNAFTNVEKVDAEYSPGSGGYSIFKKITGPDEVGERLDDGIEILKDLVVGLNNLTTITKGGFEDLGGKMDKMLVKQDQTISILSGMDKKMDNMLDKQDETTEAVRDLKRNDGRFVRMEKDIRTIKSKLGIR
jgi:acylphosphatase